MAILEAARECFSREGPAATSTQAVSVAAGVSHGTLFLHFPSRDSLVESVILDLVDRLHARLGPRAGSLADEFTAQLRLLGEVESLYAHLLREEFTLPEGARRALVGLEGVLTGRVAGLVELEGAARPGLAPRLVAATWLALIQDVLRRGEAGRSSPRLALRGPEIRQFCLRLLEP